MGKGQEKERKKSEEKGEAESGIGIGGERKVERAIVESMAKKKAKSGSWESGTLSVHPVQPTTVVVEQVIGTKNSLLYLAYYTTIVFSVSKGDKSRLLLSWRMASNFCPRPVYSRPKLQEL